MELTYTTTNNGYTILSGGVPWIIQDGYIPYPGQDMAKAAENHIDQILDDRARAEEYANQPSPMEKLEAELTQTQLALAEIAGLLGGAE